MWEEECAFEWGVGFGTPRVRFCLCVCVVVCLHRAMSVFVSVFCGCVRCHQCPVVGGANSQCLGVGGGVSSCGFKFQILHFLRVSACLGLYRVLKN